MYENKVSVYKVLISEVQSVMCNGTLEGQLGTIISQAMPKGIIRSLEKERMNWVVSSSSSLLSLFGASQILINGQPVLTYGP
jgi:hypothetical protein